MLGFFYRHKWQIIKTENRTKAVAVVYEWKIKKIKCEKILVKYSHQRKCHWVNEKKNEEEDWFSLFLLVYCIRCFVIFFVLPSFSFTRFAVAWYRNHLINYSSSHTLKRERENDGFFVFNFQLVMLQGFHIFEDEIRQSTGAESEKRKHQQIFHILFSI